MGCLVIPLVGVAGCFGAQVASHFDRDSYSGIVTDKAIKRCGERDDRYLVTMRLGGPQGPVRVFENTDTLLEGKFASSDLQGGINVGGWYQVDTYGWRIPVFSIHENIVHFSEVSPEDRK